MIPNVERLLNAPSGGSTKLLTISQWIDGIYGDHSAPTPRTVRNWINNGWLYAERHGRKYFIPADQRPRHPFG